MNLFMKQKQTHRHKKQTMVTKGDRGWRDKLGVWDYQIHTTIPYSTEDYIQYLVIKHNGKEYGMEMIYIYDIYIHTYVMEKIYMCMCVCMCVCVCIYIHESLCCTPETKTTL